MLPGVRDITAVLADTPIAVQECEVRGDGGVHDGMKHFEGAA